MSMIDLAERIQRHNEAVRRVSQERIRYRDCCAICGKSAGFAPHELRSRQLRYMVGTAVICACIVLARWRCILCNRTFTDYPDFRTPL
jgi:hypothetical protein